MFPAVTEQFVFNDQTITLQLPQETAVQQWYREQDQQTPFPFWARVWPSAKALTQYLAEHPHYYAHKKVVEFGAGIGLPALFTATAAADVLMTDYANDAMHWFNEQHALLNKNVQYKHFDWYQNSAWPPADCVLMSDVNYKDDDFKDLLNLIQHYTAQHTMLILATPQRIIARGFVQIITPYIKAVTSTEIEEHPISIYVLS
jgi:predicted nicotinamide N-methyase